MSGQVFPLTRAHARGLINFGEMLASPIMGYLSIRWAELTKQYLTTEELAIWFGYASPQSVHTAISKDTFPIPTYKLGKLRVADREVVSAFFDARREEGMQQLAVRELLA